VNVIEQLYEMLGIQQTVGPRTTRVFYLRADDSAATIVDRLDWVDAERVALVIPVEAGVLIDRLDLVRVKRYAAKLRTPVGLVTIDSAQRAVASELKIPVFNSVNQAQRKHWRRSAAPSREIAAVPAKDKERPNPADLRPTDSRISAYILLGITAGLGLVLAYDLATLTEFDPRRLGKDAAFGIAGGLAAGLLFFLLGWLIRREFPRLFRWLRGTLAVSVFVFGLLAPVGAAFLFLPGARVVVTPSRMSRSAIARITVVVPPPGQEDGLDEIDFEGQRIPGRRVSAEVGATATSAATGSADVPTSRATGTVVFSNLLAQDYTLGQGTAVRTSAGTPVRFLTVGDVTVPPLGQAAIGIEAVEPGPQGNVDVGLINRVEGAASRAVRVTNPEATRGGGVSQVRAVTEDDRDALRRTVLTQLRSQGYQRVLERPEADGGLREGEYLIPGSVRVFQVLHETYDRFATEEAESVKVEMRVLVTGVVVDLGDAYNLAQHVLSRQVPEGYELLDVTYHPGLMGDNVLGNGTLTFFVEADGVAEARVQGDELVRRVRGKPVEEGMTLLSTAQRDDDLLIADVPEVEIWPEWASGRFPWLAWRIEVVEAPEG
jgi:hypothetical protein